ncbi:YtpI family protein [Cohnella pontilimi]|uniref:YtpI family protein n=1 Tax=Cohnella pontilimi TaxID=2564100 RepID=UPI001FE456F0|nr:YtpI family protein [Cohnella pontilimi]
MIQWVASTIDTKKELLLLIQVLQWALGLLIVVTSVLSAVFSYRARRSADPVLRGLNTARMNICMGLMLVFISLIQMIVFTGSTLRVVIGAIFQVLGLFNLFAGMRNQSHFNRMKRA